MKNILSVFVLSSVLFTSSKAQNLLENGSFEISSESPNNSVVTVSANNSTTIGNWTVRNATIMYVDRVFTPTDGNRFVHLNLSAAGAIEQTLVTVVGQSYRVYFDVSAYVGRDGEGARPVNGKGIALDGVTAIATKNFSFDGTGKTFATVGWSAQQFDFTATGAQTIIRFESSMPNGSGPCIDNARVVPGHADGENWVIDGAPVFDLRMPVSTRVGVNTKARFEVHALGATPLTYQWYSYTGNNTPVAINDATAAAYEVASATQSLNNRRYMVIAQNSIGKITNISVLAIVQPPQIASQPQEQRVSVGAQLNFGPGSFSGSAPETFQWYKDNQAVEGATSQFFTRPSAALSDNGNYYVVGRNVAGEVTSATVPVTVVDGPVAPWFRNGSNPTQPYYNVQEGGTISLSANVLGSFPLTYFFYKGETFLEANQFSSYSKFNAALADSGQYSVIVSNTAGKITLPPTAVTVYPQQTAPVLTPSFKSETAVEGGAHTLTATLQSGTHVKYQWWRANQGGSLTIPVEGATSQELILQNVTPEMAGTYGLIATNFVGQSTAVTSLSVAAKPRLNPLGFGYEGPAGVIVNFNASVQGNTAGLTYQWYFNDQPVSTSSFYSVTASEATAGQYYVIVKNAAGETRSDTVSIVIRPVVASNLEFEIVADRSKAIPGGVGTYGIAGNAELHNRVVIFEGRRNFNTVPTIARWQTGQLTRIADGTTSLPGLTATATFLTGVSAEDGNISTFIADSDASAVENRHGLFAHANGSITSVASQSTEFPGKGGLKPDRIGYGNRVGNKTAFLMTRLADATSGPHGFRGLYVWDGATITKWVDADGGLPAGTGIWAGNSSQVGFDGHTIAAWLVDSANDNGIFATTDGGPLRKIAFKGDAIPGGGTFQDFNSPPVVVDGKILFLANKALYEFANETLRVVAKPGDAISGGNTPFTAVGYGFGYDGDGGVVFSATGPGTKSGIYRTKNGSITEEISTFNSLFGSQLRSVSLADIEGNDWLIHASFDGVNTGLYVRFGSSVGPTLTVTREGNTLHITWDGPGKLEQSTAFSGWAEASPAGVTSADITIDGSATTRFFRVVR